MPSEEAEMTIALIIEAYAQSGMSQEAFGALLELMAFDFKLGMVCEPLDPAETDSDKLN